MTHMSQWKFGCALGLGQEACGRHEPDPKSRGYEAPRWPGCPSCAWREPANEATRRAERAWQERPESSAGRGNRSELYWLQKEVKDLYRLQHYHAGPRTLCLGAMEELGELAQAILLSAETKDFVPSKRKRMVVDQMPELLKVAEEVGDIITYLLALCNTLHIRPYFKRLEKKDVQG